MHVNRVKAVVGSDPILSYMCLSVQMKVVVRRHECGCLNVGK